MGDEMGIGTFADAVKAAEVDLLAGKSTEADPVVADGIDQAPVVDPDQSSESTEAVESVFGDLLEEQAANVDPMSVLVEVDGFDNPVSTQELVDGYLRQADYTRKTQALADDRGSFDKDNETAIMLLQKLRDNPAETVAALAIEAGLLTQEQLPADLAVRDAAIKFPSQEDIDAQVQDRVNAGLADHPDVISANEMLLRQQIDTEFTVIEGQIGQTLSDSDRNAVLAKAVEIGTTRLDAAFATLMHEADLMRKQRTEVEAAAPARASGGEASESVNDGVEPSNTIEGLFGQAEQGLIT
jgi:hypothetical protein